MFAAVSIQSLTFTEGDPNTPNPLSVCVTVTFPADTVFNALFANFQLSIAFQPGTAGKWP